MKDERRIGVRYSRKEVIYVELVSASHDQLDLGEVVSCETIDVSEEGLQITMDNSPPEGAILDLCVELGGIPRKFFLTAEVRWVRLLPGENAVRVGFQLFEGDQTDIHLWQELFRGEK